MPSLAKKQLKSTQKKQDTRFMESYSSCIARILIIRKEFLCLLYQAAKNKIQHHHIKWDDMKDDKNNQFKQMNKVLNSDELQPTRLIKIVMAQDTFSKQVLSYKLQAPPLPHPQW